MWLSYKYRLYPNVAQYDGLTGMLGAFCDLYNAGLQQRIEAYQRRGASLRYGNQAAELKAVREADERLAGYSFSAEQQVLRRLDKSFSAFFSRIRRGAKPGFPRFRAKSRFESAEFRVGDGLTIRKSKRLGIVGIPGEIKVKWHRELPADAKVGAAVISRFCGKWYVCFQIELPDAAPTDRAFAPIGIDLGLTSLVALSTGETVPAPQWTGAAAAGLRVRQRVVARKPNKRSSHRAKAVKRLARYQRRTANRRRDFAHKLSRRLVDTYTHIAFEDLNIKGLAAGMLAKSVHNAAWAQLILFVSYKAANAGGEADGVRPHGTTIDCSGCGVAVPKRLGDRTHICPDCGLVLCRDVNAARNVLARTKFKPHGTCGRAQSQRIAASLPEKPSAEADGVFTFCLGQ